jgi:2-dehydro-3-deoxyphosphogluconate aldolase / (4S)-4-hydroxy-2-oxoglutarate aldolase
VGALSRAPGVDPVEAIEARLRAAGIVPVVELPEAELAVPLADALLAGGLSCVEITFRTPAAREGLAAIREAHPEILLGAGTVLEEEQVASALEAGADFAVAPGTSPEIIRVAQERGLPLLPGTCTPSDVEQARRLGLRLLKFFPAEPIGGVSYLRALCGPYRDVRFVPTGSITPATLVDYLGVPQVVACGGSWMVKPELLLAQEWGRVTELAAEAAALAGSAR